MMLQRCVEVLGPIHRPGSIVARKYFDERVVWELKPRLDGWTLGVANLLDDIWGGRGITNELFDIVPYTKPRSWAICFQEAGWDGLKGRLRHALSTERFGVALFGDAGPQSEDARFREPVLHSIDDGRIAAFHASTGIRIEASPVPAAGLRVVS